MDYIRYLKLVLVIVIILFFVFRLINKFRKRNDGLLDINVRKDHIDVLIPASERSNLENTIIQYRDKEYDKYDNLVYKFSEILLDPLPKLINQPDEVKYFEHLNSQQRVFSLLMQFEGQVDNGGVYQFLFNRPHSAFAMTNALAAIRIEPLTNDYKQVLNELEKNVESFTKDKMYWNNPELSFEDKWNRFQEGRRYIPTGNKIEEYFYDEAFKKKWHKAIEDYVKANLDKLIAK